MLIPVNDRIHLSPPVESDIPYFVKYLNNREIYDRTLMVPSPYTGDDGKFFIDLCNAGFKSFGHHLKFSIRNEAGEVLGGVGFHGRNTIPAIAHKDEIGYWTAPPYWGQGIMTASVKALLEYGRTVRGLKRFEAPIYDGNIASEKVLLKCGFTCEGISKDAYFRSGRFHDAKLFALVERGS
jgi:[ribosomal protein S5]-alanine N-acetyltransferase